MVGGQPVRRAGARSTPWRWSPGSTRSWSRCGCCGTATSRGRRPAWRRSASTRTRRAHEGVRSLPIGMHHADWAHAEDGELRSELVTALRDDTGALLVAGFLGGWEHDGTFRRATRARRVGRDRALDRGVPRRGRAAAGRASRAARGHAGRRRGRPVAAAGGVGRRPRRGGPRPHDGAVPGRVVLLVPLLPRRHGGRPAGEPRAGGGLALRRVPARRRLPGRHRRLARRRTTSSPPPSTAWPPPSRPRVGRRGSGSPRSSPAAESEVARRHPDWLAVHAPTRHAAGRHGERRRGAAPSTPSTRATPRCSTTSRRVARALVDAGYPYLKLDFTYAPSMHGGYADPGRTPAQRVRAGFEAIRRGAGRRHVPPRLRRPDRRGGRPGRRHAHRRRRGAVVAPAGRPVPTRRATPAASRPRSTRGATRSAGRSSTASCGSTTRTA